MSTYPTVAEMLSTIGAAFLIIVVLTTVLGYALRAAGRRGPAAPASVTRIPAQREARTGTHAHAA